MKKSVKLRELSWADALLRTVQIGAFTTGTRKQY